MQPDVVLTSAFSLGMLADLRAFLEVRPSHAREVAEEIDRARVFTSGVGHPATRDMLQRILGVVLPEINPQRRPRLALRPGTIVYVAQYVGPRLAEGEVMDNPDPEHFEFVEVTIHSRTATGEEA